MSKIKIWLTSLLAIQIALGSFLWFAPEETEQNNIAKPIFSLAQQKINKIVISTMSDKSKVKPETVTLLKQQDIWSLANTSDIPVNKGMVTTMLQQLVLLKSNWPIATSRGAQSRFKVANNDYNRHVKLYAGANVVADFYLGTSPGFKKNNFRQQGNDNIYTLALNLYDFPSDKNAWLDKSVLAAKGLNEISGNDFQLINRESKQIQAPTSKAIKTAIAQWQFTASTVVDEAEKANTLDQAKAATLAQMLTGLTVIKLSDKLLKKADFSLKAKSNNVDLQWYFKKQGEQYLVSRNDISAVFTLSKDKYLSLQKMQQKAFLLQHKEKAKAVKETQVKQDKMLKQKNDSKAIKKKGKSS